MSQKTDDRMGYLLLIGVVAFFVAGVAAYFYFGRPSVPIDPVTNCPKDIPEASIGAVLIDTTDPLSPVQAEFLKKELEMRAEGVPRFGELSCLTSSQQARAL